MEVEDLYIGCWYYHDPSIWSYRNDDGVISNYGKFNEDCFVWDTSDWYAIGECILDLEAVKPVKLTEEWLIEFGFKEIKPLENDEHKWSTYSKNGVHIDLPYFEFNIEEISQEIKYVHQIQNLYYTLTGEKLTLKQ